MERRDYSKKRKYHRGRRQKKTGIQKIKICIYILFLLLMLVLGIVLLLKNVANKSKDVAENSSIIKKEEKGKNEEHISKAKITLKGETNITLKLGEEYSEAGYLAEGDDGTDLTDKVQVDASAINRVGEQQIIYTVKDNDGNEARVTRGITILPNTEYEAHGLPICMYHYVYDTNSPPENVDSNFISVEALDEEMKYLRDNDYYFPTWQEVRDYVDGKLLLPEKSIVVTFDDGPNFMDLGIPVLEKYQVPSTSFVITSYWDNKEMLYAYNSDYLKFQSHSHNMHQGGGNVGHGGIYTALSREEVLEDLEQSFNICGNKDAFAYPFGDYTEEGIVVLQEAGLLCAVTTENSKCYPGQNPYLLPRVRMLGSQSLDAFISVIQ